MPSTPSRHPLLAASCVLAVAWALGAAGPPAARAHAAAHLAVGETIVLAPVADAYVRADARKEHFGSSPRFAAQGGRRARRAYLRFQVSLPPAVTVRRAKLRLYTLSGDRGAGVTLRAAGHDFWSESALTWRTQPKMGAVVDRKRIYRDHAWIALDATPIAREGGTVTVVLTTTGRSWHGFRSREARNGRPQLVITTGLGSPDPPPPPQQPDPSLPGELRPTPLNPDDNFIADWSNASLGIATQQEIDPFADLLQEAPERSRFESAPVRQGDLSLHMTVNQNDTDHNGSTERTQLFPRYYLSDQDDVWMSMSFWLDNGFDFPANGNEWDVILDGFPNTPDLSHKGRNAVLELLLSSGSGSGPQWKLIVRGGVSTDDGNTYPRNEGYGLGSATTGNWVDFLIHYKPSTGSDGEVKVWRAPGNAQFPTNPVASDSGVNVATASGIPLVTYPEFGLYRSTSSTPSSLHIGGGCDHPDARGGGGPVLRLTCRWARPQVPRVGVGRPTFRSRATARRRRSRLGMRPDDQSRRRRESRRRAGGRDPLGGHSNPHRSSAPTSSRLATGTESRDR